MDYRDAETVPSADRPPKRHNWIKEKCLIGSAGRRAWEDPEYVIEVSSAILVAKVAQVDCGGVVATPPATSASRIAQLYQGDFELVLVANVVFKRG
jgi:hypothetical protein